MNFSHGSYEYHQSVIDNARAAEAQQAGRPLAIALDTKGPEIRTGDMVNGEDVKILAGHKMVITTDPAYKDKCDDKTMFVDYTNLPKVIDKGKPIFVDDGVLSFHVIDIDGCVGVAPAGLTVRSQNVHVEAINNGVLSSRKGVNLPGTDVDLPALSEKDKADLQFGVKNGVDMIFASFIRRAQDVIDIRKVLGKEGASIKIICKVRGRVGVTR